MNEGTGTRDGAGAGEAAGMGVQDAAVIMGDARERARHELTVNRPAIFASWALRLPDRLRRGLALGPRAAALPTQAGWALALLALLAVLALGVTAQLTDRATSGVGGVSARRRRIYWLSLPSACLA